MVACVVYRTAMNNILSVKVYFELESVLLTFQTCSKRTLQRKRLKSIRSVLYVVHETVMNNGLCIKVHLLVSSTLFTKSNFCTFLP